MEFMGFMPKYEPMQPLLSELSFSWLLGMESSEQDAKKKEDHGTGAAEEGTAATGAAGAGAEAGAESPIKKQRTQ